MTKGKISVHTENLLPIIKKWLYSDNDIFLRELVSNAQDAIMKHKKLVSIGECQNDEKYEIKVEVDKENSIITITDNGIGMTSEEVEKYINQVAFSGAEEFVKQFEEEKDENSKIIGHFGLGFYSAFMASGVVEIDTLSYKDGAKAVHWISDGGAEFEISESDKKSRGTVITLHIAEESKEFLEMSKARETLVKYCGFLPVEIYLVDKSNKQNEEIQPINDTNPLWLKKPSECTEEEYKNFYHKVFMDFSDPLFWIHLNVDFPFNLKGILYFPKLNHEYQSLEGQVKLFNNQVFIADNIKEVIPEYLLLLKGVVDCPDLPLNVSRSFLQNDGYVTKVSAHITKKVADKLCSLFKTDRENFEKYWDDINPFVKYGCMRDEKFYEKVKDIIIFKKLDDSYVTLSELTSQENKELFYVTDTRSQSQYVEMLKEENIEPVLLNNGIDNHFLSFIEYKISDLTFKRVDSFVSDRLKNNDEKKDTDTASKIKDLFAKYLPGEAVVAENLKTDKICAMFVVSEEARRMEEMQRLYGGMNLGAFPETPKTLVINTNSAIIRKIPQIDDENIRDLLCKNIIDMAKLSHDTLDGEGRLEFIRRNTEIMDLILKNM